MGFMDSTLDVFVTIAAVDMLTGPVSRMAGSMGILDQRTKEVQSTMAGFRNMAFVGAGITAIGAVLAAGLISATNEAGKLQIAMMSVKEAMGLTNAELQKATNMAMTLGIPTQFTAIQTAGIMATAANAGLSKSAILDPNTIRQYVNFADVQAFSTKKEDPNTAIAAAVKMANLAGITGQAATARYLDQVNAALMHTTDTATQFATNMRYYVGTAEQKGMSAGDIVTANTWLSRMGLGGGRGGMATQQFLSRSVYGSSGATADAAMQAAGLVVNGRSVFEDAKGAFIGFPAAMKALQDFNTREGGNANITGPLLTKIFGTSGLRVAQAMMQASAAPQYAQVQQQVGSTAPVNAQQVAFNATWAGQTKQLTTTLQDIWTSFGFSAMNSLLPLITSVNKLLYNLLLFMQVHPVLANIIADFAKFGAAIFLTVGPLMVFIGLLGWIKTSGTIVTGLQMIGGAFKLLTVSTQLATAAQWLWNLAMDVCPFVLMAAGLALLVIGLVELVEHFKEVCQWLENVWTWWHKFDNMPSQTPVSVSAANAGKNAGLGAAAQQQVNTAVASTLSPLGAGQNFLGRPLGGSKYTFASGTNYAPGGMSLVGEQGPELLNIPRGSQVINNASLNGMLGGGNVIENAALSGLLGGGAQGAPGEQGDSGANGSTGQRGAQGAPGTLGGVTMGDVAINIYPTPNQSPTQIAKAASEELGRVIRNARRGQSLKPQIAY
jgi:TP901 family phage tail tape measure protein